MPGDVSVLFMGNFIYPRGMADAKRIQHFLDYLVEESISAKVLLLRQGGAPVTRESSAGRHRGVEYLTIGWDIRLDFFLLFALVKYLAGGIAALIAFRSENREKKKILYCYGGLTLENIPFVLFARLSGYRVVLDIVEDNTFLKEKLHLAGKLKWAAGEMLEKHIPRFAHAVVVISNYLHRLYRKELGESLPVCLIPITARCQERAAKEAPRGGITFVYSGSFAVKDGLEVLLQAFAEVHRRHEEAVLLLTGVGANLARYRELIDACPGARYIGYLEDAEFESFLREADVLCITRTGSTYANAGFPFKLGEYLATGNPVICSEVGDVNCYLSNMEDAIIVKPDDVQGVVRAMEFCIGNPGKAAAIGLSGQRKCREFFDPAVNGRKLVELMQTL